MAKNCEYFRFIIGSIDEIVKKFQWQYSAITLHGSIRYEIKKIKKTNFSDKSECRFAKPFEIVTGRSVSFVSALN